MIMKNLLVFSMTFLSLFTLAQEKPDYESIAGKIVNYSLGVQVGEVVQINGTVAEIELMEALLVAVIKAGGDPIVNLILPQAEKKAIMASSVENLQNINTYGMLQLRLVDCVINTGSIHDPKLYSDVPEEKLIAIRKSNQSYQDVYKHTDIRSVTIGQTGGIPSVAYANYVGMEYDKMIETFWNALNYDNNELMLDANKIKLALKAGAHIKLTSENGTNLAFRLSAMEPNNNCGKCIRKKVKGPSSVWLPAGEVYTCIDPSSATGTLVIPRFSFRGDVITNLKMVFINGRLTDLSSSDNIEKFMIALEGASGDKDVLSALDIGINRSHQYEEGSSYSSWEMGGMITLTVGNNVWAGGDVESDYSFIVHAPMHTLTVNKIPVVESGKLADLSDI